MAGENKGRGLLWFVLGIILAGVVAGVWCHIHYSRLLRGTGGWAPSARPSLCSGTIQNFNVNVLPACPGANPSSVNLCAGDTVTWKGANFKIHVYSDPFGAPLNVADFNDAMPMGTAQVLPKLAVGQTHTF